ncbi:integrase [Lactobacillus sp. PV037]|uniref:site-specific integrase n=1 Tax=unclassified Lactobacillus TaxID=2620435 RepID=UPI00223EDA55|nr:MULTISPECIES: site-specific integrase [unclassified Lactobacillus]QNQ82381.1 integrase [Lactobacillus sp. PV012]QNQ83505.1 integrase [Lactobacillus sp. PV037]
MYNYPYIKNFNEWCAGRNLRPETVISINQSINYFWNYYRDTSSHPPTLEDITGQDIRQFLVELEIRQNRSIQTINKYVTHLKKYFSFLYDHKLMPNYVLTDIKGYTFDRTPRFCLDWIDHLEEIVKNSAVSLDAKKILILIAHGYEPEKFLKLTLTRVKADKIITNSLYLTTLSQPLIETDLIFHTKKGLPITALTSLSRRIIPDREILNFNLTPGSLRLSYIYRLVNDSSLSDDDLMKLLHVNRKNITYYRDQAYKAKFTNFSPSWKK